MNLSFIRGNWNCLKLHILNNMALKNYLSTPIIFRKQTVVDPIEKVPVWNGLFIMIITTIISIILIIIIIIVIIITIIIISIIVIAVNVVVVIIIIIIIIIIMFWLLPLS